MNLKKIKLMKVLAMTGGLAAVVLTPVVVTACGAPSSSENSNQIVPTTPQLKNEITSIGKINDLLVGDSSGYKANLEKNLATIFNNQKSTIITNFDAIPTAIQNDITFNVDAHEWSNEQWGAQNFDQWANSVGSNQPSLQNTAVWNGSKTTPNKDEMLVIYSNESFKNELTKENNKLLKQIALNAQIIKDANIENVSLANADLKIDVSGNIHIGLEVTNQVNSMTKWELVIPANVIQINTNLNINGIYNGVAITKGDMNFVYSNINGQEMVSFTEQAKAKEIITLKEKENVNNQLGLWTNIGDKDILSQLNWLNNNANLESHKDGSKVDASALNLDQIKQDLGLEANQNEILGLVITMDSRKPSDATFTGSYEIYLQVKKQSTTESDINLATSTIKVVPKTNTNQKLQLLVPNAFTLDAISGTTENDFVIRPLVSKTNAQIQIGLGAKGIQKTDWVSIMEANMTKANFSRVSSHFEKVFTVETNPYINGVYLTYDHAWLSTNENNKIYKSMITTVAKLKPGYIFKTNFDGLKGKYNGKNDKQEITFMFGVNYTEKDQNGVFYVDNSLAPQQIKVTNFNDKNYPSVK